MEDLLIIDDNEDVRKQLRWGLEKEYTIHLAQDRQEALSLFEKLRTQVVLLDLGLPPHEEGAEEGFACLEGILRHEPATKVIVVTGRNEREHALRAIQLGAYDFYQKPIDLKELKIIVSRAMYLRNLEREVKELQRSSGQGASGFSGMIGLCPAMEKIFATIRKIASSDVPVLIIGESGTGKELVARAIHSLGARKEGKFVAINCGAIPENLLESELFGFEKGAFTGAHARTSGKVEYAHDGTLFLDEVGEMPLNLQVKLLRFLQDKTIQRVGGREDIPVNARIVAATNIDIARAIREEKFREDLYYRLGVVMLNLPPLRERGDDVVALATMFLNKFSEAAHKKITGFSAASLELLKSYTWPGNVRELENRVQRAVLFAESSKIELYDFGFSDLPQIQTKERMTLKEAKDKVERDMTVSAIEKHNGNVTKISDELGVSRTTLYDIMKKHGIT
ncbi:MAG: PEP-CTERM-box response regulator transcription factor [Nitrospirota bacterium]